MAIRSPRQILRNYAVWIDGVSYIGQVDDFTPPKLTHQMEDFRPGGFNMPLELEMGLEKMEGEMTVSGTLQELIARAGLIAQPFMNIQFRGVLRDEGGVDLPHIIDLRARFKEVDPGSAKAGEMRKCKFSYDARYYRERINNVETLEIDVINMVHRVNGVDELAAQRAILGI